MEQKNNKPIQFVAEIEISLKWKNAAFVKIPFDVKATMGSGRPKVHVLFDQKIVYRGILSRIGTPYHILILTKEVRNKIQKGIADKVEVLVKLDNEKREVELPQLLVELFNTFPKIKEVFNKLSYTRQKEYANFIESALKEETKQRRLQKVKIELQG